MTPLLGASPERRETMVTEVTEIKQFEAPPVEQRDDEPVAHRREFIEIRVLPELIPIEHIRSASLGPAVPSELLLGTLGDGRLRVRMPIAVRLETEAEHVIAQAVELNEFGFGQNLSEALADLQRAVVELYFTLKNEQGRLGPDLELVWAKLREKIELQER